MTEPINMSNEIIDTCQQIESKWDNAISIAKKEMRALALRHARLKQAIKIFKANKRDGVQWPGENNEG
jgi:hypothetical protein